MISGYEFKNFSYTVKHYNAATMSFSATLVFEGNFVATVTCANMPKTPSTPASRHQRPAVTFGEIDQYAFHRLQQRLANWPAADSFGNPYSENDKLFLLLLQLGQQAYWHKRAQQLSLKNTVFRLKGDPAGEFRFVKGHPLDPEVESFLDERYGPDLDWVFRSAKRPPGALLFGDVQEVRALNA